MEILRKLQGVRRDLAVLEEQGKVAGFFNNSENASKLGSLVEDIRDVMMEYQVCIRKLSITGTSDARTRLHYNKISITTVAGSS